MSCLDHGDAGFGIGLEYAFAGRIAFIFSNVAVKVSGLPDVFRLYDARIDNGEVVEAHTGEHFQAADIPADTNENQALLRDEIVIEMPSLSTNGKKGGRHGCSPSSR